MGWLGDRLVKMSVGLWIRDGVRGWQVGEDVLFRSEHLDTLTSCTALH